MTFFLSKTLALSLGDEIFVWTIQTKIDHQEICNCQLKFNKKGCASGSQILITG
jgi:hypothetical protein